MTNDIENWDANASSNGGQRHAAALQGEERLLVFVIARKAESRLCDLFERVPPEFFNRRDVHFLVADDASDDSGPFRLSRWLADHDVSNATIIQTGSPQGDGGTQKLGYRAAIDGGFDAVILLRADGHSTPEHLPLLIKTWRESRADVMLAVGQRGEASPLNNPKRQRGRTLPVAENSERCDASALANASGYIGWRRWLSRGLTAFQNRLIGWKLSGYFTSLRLFSTSFLQSVPFETNSNGALFDTDILLQAAYAEAHVEELELDNFAIESNRPSGLRHAAQIVGATLQFKAHRMGMLCSLKLRRLTAERYRDKTELPYSSHSVALNVIRTARPRTVLDIGCGPGHVAARCRDMGVRVTGIDLHRPPADSLTEFISADLEADSLPADVWDFDAVLLLDVIEHLADPEKFLLAQRHGHRARPSVGNAPLFVISTPNVAFFAVRLNLLLGRFNYAERGILDITHKRLFTRSSLLQLLRECGYQVERCHAVGAPFAAVVGGRLGRFLGAIANGLARLLPTLFAFQFLIECRPHPGARQLLAHAIRCETRREESPVEFSLR